MGLDMYLYRRKGVEREKAQEFAELAGIKGKVGYVSVSAEVAYWRKANAIHQWFMNKGGEFQDNNIELGVEDLKELLALCKDLKSKIKVEQGQVKNGYTYENGEKKPILEDGEVITNPEICEEMLPTMAGFFFGSTDYDEYYVYQLDSTIEQLEEVISNHQDNEWYMYECSW